MSSATSINAMISRMSLEEKVGQCLILGFSGNDLRVHDYERVVEELKPAGFRLSPNHQDSSPVPAPSKIIPIEDYAAILQHLQDLSLKHCGWKLLYSLDQEGGSTSNLSRGLVLFPYQMGYGMCLEPKDAEDMAYAVGSQLMAVGLNMIHGPVLDINVDWRNPGINVRAFHSNVDVVCEFGKAVLAGYKRAGIIASVKHLPGKGDLVVDTHVATASLAHPLDLLFARELKPFKALVEAGAEVLMSSHVTVPAFGDDKLPFTISKPGMDLVRNEFGFNGVIETDHIMMQGLLKYFPQEEIAIRCLEVGNDLILYKLVEFENRLKIRDALCESVVKGRVSEAHLNTAVERVLTLKARYKLNDTTQVHPNGLDQLLADGHIQKLAQDHHRQICVVTHDPKGQIPFTATHGKASIRPLVIDLCSQLCEDSAAEQAQRGMLKGMLPAYLTEYDYLDLNETQITDRHEEIFTKAKTRDWIIMTCFTRWEDDAIKLSQDLASAGNQILLIAYSPYLKYFTPEASAIITTFSDTSVGIQAGIDVVFGRQPAAKIRRAIDPGKVETVTQPALVS